MLTGNLDFGGMPWNRTRRQHWSIGRTYSPNGGRAENLSEGFVAARIYRIQRLVIGEKKSIGKPQTARWFE